MANAIESSDSGGFSSDQRFSRFRQQTFQVGEHSFSLPVPEDILEVGDSEAARQTDATMKIFCQKTYQNTADTMREVMTLLQEASETASEDERRAKLIQATKRYTLAANILFKSGYAPPGSLIDKEV